MTNIEIGKYNELTLLDIKEHGAYLEGDEKFPRILLPTKQIPKGAKEGDIVKVFIYKDSSDRIIATSQQPYAAAGEVAYLEVVQRTKVGYFLNIGLERDVLLPFSEIPYRVEEGRKYLVYLYVDKSERLCATAKIEEHLKYFPPYTKGDRVKGVVYKNHPELGSFIAVDNRFSALIPKRECFRKIRIGEELEVRVIKTFDDGKMDVTPNQEAHKQMGDDGEKILEILGKNQGYLNLHDKSSPEDIYARLQMSKAAFKRAIGGLFKQGKISIDSDGIHLK